MGRMLPVECEHGRVIDWGDFGPDQNDGTVGAGCAECDSRPPPRLAELIQEWPAEAVRLLVEAGALEPTAWECSFKDAGRYSSKAECDLGGVHIPVRFQRVPSAEDPSDWDDDELIVLVDDEPVPSTEGEAE